MSAKTISRLESDEPVRPETLVLVLRSLGLPDTGPETADGTFNVFGRPIGSEPHVDRVSSSPDIDVTLRDFPSVRPPTTRRNLFLWSVIIASPLFAVACMIALCMIWATLGWQGWMPNAFGMMAPALIAYICFAAFALFWLQYNTVIAVTISRPPAEPLVNRIVHAARSVAGSTQVALNGVRSVDGTYTLNLEMDASPTRHTEIMQGLRALGISTSIHSR